MDPAAEWRGHGASGPTPPEPWPMRVQCFIHACAVEAASHERTLADLAEAFTKAKRD